MRRRRCNIEKQEQVVKLLWEFAKNIQQNPEKGCVATNVETGTKLSLDHVGEALHGIMANFGYGVLEVQ